MKSPVKKVAAIHDLSGFGRASLTVVTPILSVMGIQVCPLPTAVLSTHSKFPDFHFVDLTDHMRPIVEHWKQLDLKFDAIYSGYLGSPHQVKIVEDIIEEFRTDCRYIVVDPVLGDDGKLYTSMAPEMVDEMKTLIKSADIITPNLTEVCLLLDMPYQTDISLKQIKEYILELASRGPRIVIATSVPDVSDGCTKPDPHGTSVIAYNKRGNRFWKVRCSYLPADYPGTGDSFTSVVVGSLLQGDSLPIALDRAVRFIITGVRSTFGYEYDSREGILLERVLHNLDLPVQISSYELLD